jgi:predicted amidophosphoribosyltransferase
MIGLKEIKESLLHVVFPHVCDGCGSDLLNIESRLCIRCLSSLPETNFEIHPNNPVEKDFWGRLPINKCFCSFIFYKRITCAASDASIEI